MSAADSLTVKGLSVLYPNYKNPFVLRRMSEDAVDAFGLTVVVLDDDPTGTQTVSGVPVIMAWDKELLAEELVKSPRMLFILTNSRALTSSETKKLHTEIAENLVSASRLTGRDILVVSRSDSTLRGHFPLETGTLRDVFEKLCGNQIDGEIICPFFLEGGRYTFGDVHYLADRDSLIPVADSEFASDKTFGYKNSHLGRWVEEKTHGKYTASSCIYITMEELRGEDRRVIREKLLSAERFNKIIVNAVCYEDLYVFVPEMLAAISCGKHFIMRTAASILRVLSGNNEPHFVSGADIRAEDKSKGGVVIVGSHVNKTTRQLECLMSHCAGIAPLEFNQHLVLDESAFSHEINRVAALADEYVRSGQDVAVYTRRERLDLGAADREEELRLAVRISDGLVKIISSLAVRPKFIVAKGGITSSDVATKGLAIIKAEVMGQILPGIPVWRSGSESKFPGMPYVIFPGNVGNDESLFEAVKILNS